MVCLPPTSVVADLPRDSFPGGYVVRTSFELSACFCAISAFFALLLLCRDFRGSTLPPSPWELVQGGGQVMGGQ